MSALLRKMLMLGALTLLLYHAAVEGAVPGEPLYDYYISLKAAGERQCDATFTRPSAALVSGLRNTTHTRSYTRLSSLIIDQPYLPQPAQTITECAYGCDRYDCVAFLLADEVCYMGAGVRQPGTVVLSAEEALKCTKHYFIMADYIFGEGLTSPPCRDDGGAWERLVNDGLRALREKELLAATPPLKNTIATQQPHETRVATDPDAVAQTADTTSTLAPTSFDPTVTHHGAPSTTLDYNPQDATLSSDMLHTQDNVEMLPEAHSSANLPLHPVTDFVPVATEDADKFMTALPTESPTTPHSYTTQEALPGSITSGGSLHSTFSAVDDETVANPDHVPSLSYGPTTEVPLPTDKSATIPTDGGTEGDEGEVTDTHSTVTTPFGEEGGKDKETTGQRVPLLTDTSPTVLMETGETTEGGQERFTTHAQYTTATSHEEEGGNEKQTTGERAGTHSTTHELRPNDVTHSEEPHTEGPTQTIPEAQSTAEIAHLETTINGNGHTDGNDQHQSAPSPVPVTTNPGQQATQEGLGEVPSASSDSLSLYPEAASATSTNHYYTGDPTGSLSTDSPKSNVSAYCSELGCICNSGYELRVVLDDKFFTAYSIVNLGDRWTLKGDESYISYKIGYEKPPMTCVKSVRRVYGPQCPRLIIIGGIYTETSILCPGGKAPRMVTTNGGKKCNQPDLLKVVSCDQDGYYCLGAAFQAAIVYC